jgi:arylsulfatase
MDTLQILSSEKQSSRTKLMTASVMLAIGLAAISFSPAEAQEKRPSIVMLMTDDTGWADFGVYLGGANLGHPTPNIDRIAKEGAMFTSWYGQASCTAGRSSFITGRIPIRSALSVVVGPGDENFLQMAASAPLSVRLAAVGAGPIDRRAIPPCAKCR